MADLEYESSESQFVFVVILLLLSFTLSHRPAARCKGASVCIISLSLGTLRFVRLTTRALYLSLESV